jgi:amino acid transporter
MNILCIIAQLYIAVAPIGASASAYEFFANMLALPIVLVCFIGWKFWHGTRFMRASEIDLVTGRREMDLAVAKAEEMADRATWPIWKT